MVGHVVQGCLIGIANIIPGVSGGTMALMLGIYERLLKVIGQFNIAAVAELGSSLLASEDRGIRLRAWLTRMDIGFVTALGVGALGAIFLTSKLITYLLTNWHDPTYGFFLGLVLVSIVVPWRMVRRWTGLALLSMTLAAGGTVGLSLAMSGQDRLESAEKKQALKEANVASGVSATDYQPDHSLGNLIGLFVAGAVAISAMILPGISGSFILLLLGVYFEILEAVSARDLLILGVVAAGCGLGLLFFTRFLNFLLGRYHDVTVAGLVGLMVGSLYSLWPFQQFRLVGGRRIDLDPVLPALDTNFWLTIAAFLVAGGVVAGFLAIENKLRK